MTTEPLDPAAIMRDQPRPVHELVKEIAAVVGVGCSVEVAGLAVRVDRAEEPPRSEPARVAGAHEKAAEEAGVTSPVTACNWYHDGYSWHDGFTPYAQQRCVRILGHEGTHEA